MAVNNTSLITPTLLKSCLYPEDRVEIESCKERYAGENLDASEATNFYRVWEVKVAPDRQQPTAGFLGSQGT